MATHDHAIVDAMRRRVVQLDSGDVVRDQTRGVYERMAAPANPQGSQQTSSNEPHASTAGAEVAPAENETTGEQEETGRADSANGEVGEDVSVTDAVEPELKDAPEPELVESSESAETDGR